MTLYARPFISAILVAPALCLAAGVMLGASKPSEPANSGLTLETQKESDWVDNRWNKTDVGPFLASSLNLPGGRIAKGLSIKVGDGGEGAVCYDTATASWRAAWLGGFLRFDPSRYGLIQAPAVVGGIIAQAPAPPNAAHAVRYHGLHLQGKRVALDYSIGGARVIETPWLRTREHLNIFTRDIEIGPAGHTVQLGIATVSGKPAIRDGDGSVRILATSGSNALAIRIVAPGTKVVHEGRSLLLEVPAGAAARVLQIAISPAIGNEPEAAFEGLQAMTGSSEPASLLKPGAARWLPELRTRGQRGLDLDILAVDTLTVPYENPWKALMFLAGVDFTPDGAAYVCSIHGDVWRVTGVDDGLRDLRWHRFATGLFQPLGLKVRDGEVFVLGRDQITRLRDENGDGEADFYESFCNQIQTSTGGHDYVTCLEKDDAGNFYYVDPRGLHRVAADGRSVETIARGWRNPNGMGVSPDGGILTVAPQQGEWTPSSQISQAKPGGYYGYGGPRMTAERPAGYDSPLCWIPHGVDNSSGSQVWIPKGAWGALGGQMLHLLWGRCGLMLVVRDEVRGTPQGAVVPLPGRLLSGPNRGSFNARDGHLYIACSTGWQTAAARDGALQRVRFTGKPVHLPTAWHAHSNGLTLTFSEPLDRASAEDAGSYGVHQWNYRYASAYGSKDWSVANPAKEGRDEVAVKSARLLADGKTVFLEMPGRVPVMQMEIQYSLNTAAGKALRRHLWLTLNALDKDY